MFWGRKKTLTDIDRKQQDIIFNINETKRQLFLIRSPKPKIGSKIKFQKFHDDVCVGTVLYVEYKEKYINEILYPFWEIIVKYGTTSVKINHHEIIK